MVKNGAEAGFANKIFYVRDMLAINAIEDQNLYVSGNILIAFILAVPISFFVGAHTGTSVARVKGFFWVHAFWMCLCYCTLIIIPLINDAKANGVSFWQRFLWFSTAAFGGMGVGFSASPCASLSLATLANQEETALAKAFRLPAIGLG